MPQYYNLIHSASYVPSTVLGTVDITGAKTDKSPFLKEKDNTGTRKWCQGENTTILSRVARCHLRRWHLNKNLKEARSKQKQVQRPWGVTCLEQHVWAQGVPRSQGKETNEVFQLMATGLYSEWDGNPLGGFWPKEWCDLNDSLKEASWLLCWE